MLYIWEYLKSYLSKIIKASIMGMLSGLCLIFVMNQFHLAVKEGLSEPITFFSYVGLGLTGFITLGLNSEKVLFELMSVVTMNMRLDFCKVIFESEYPKIEGKKEKLFSSLVTDINNISRVIEKIPSANRNLIVSVGGVIYLIYVSWQLSAFLIVFLALALILVVRRNQASYKLDKASRKSWDEVYQNFHDTIFGIKELHLNSEFREGFFNNQLKKSIVIEASNKAKFRFFQHTTEKIAELVLIIYIGLMIAACLIYEVVSLSEFAEFLTITLFLLNPLIASAQFLKEAAPLKVMSDHMKEIGIELMTAQQVVNQKQPVEENKQSIFLKEITYSYQHEEEHGFNLGPITLEIPSNKITIIHGNNGSGKTTLSKIIAGLYESESGTIKYGKTTLEKENMQSFQDKISVVFTDNHLFRSNKVRPDDQVKLNQLLRVFEIEDKVKIVEDQILSEGLSSGQAKRLALVLSMLSDREIYIFDEWAANQDPQFKKAFYYELIPQLKSQLKTIILITHDEQYFHIADHLIHVVDGKINQSAATTRS